MKKKTLTFALLLAAFTSCSHEDVPVQTVDSQPIPAPVLSRSITAATATIVGYTADGTIEFNHDLHQTDAENNVWEWYPASNVPTQAELENVKNLVCLVPAQTVSAKTLSISPDADEQLMWDIMHVSEQHTDKKFYFDNVSHRLSKICVEVDRLQSGDYLYAYYHTGGTFDCLTGEFTKLDSRTATRIRPTKNDVGLYTTTFSVVPQTFEEGDDLLRYRDEMSNGYRNYYHEMPDTTINLAANRMFHIHAVWDTDWWAGSYISYTVHVSGVSLDVTSKTLNVGETLQLTATVTPSDADDKGVTWSTSNSSVATVDANGKVIAVGDGEATITVTTDDGAKTATCTITVNTPVSGVTLKATAGTYTYNETAGVYEMYEGDTMTFTATVAPASATNRNISWTSEKTGIATVADGVVTAVQAGTTVITVTTADGAYTAKATIRVKAKGSMGTETESGGNTGGGGIEW